MLKSFLIYRMFLLYNRVPAMLLLVRYRSFTDMIGSYFFSLTCCGVELAFSLLNGLLKPSILVWGSARIVIAERLKDFLSVVFFSVKFEEGNYFFKWN